MKTFDEVKEGLEELTWAFAAGAAPTPGSPACHAMDGALSALAWVLDVRFPEGVNVLPKWLETIRNGRASNPDHLPIARIPEAMLPRPFVTTVAVPKPSTN